MSGLKQFVFVAVISSALAGMRVAAQTCPGSEPAAGGCALARVIPGTPGYHEVVMDASTALGSSTLCTVSAGNEVWFEVTPEASGALRFSTCHPATTYDTIVTAYQGGDSMCDFMSEVACNDDTQLAECINGCSGYGSEITVSATAGTRYRFVVGAYNNNSAGCNLCLGVNMYLDTQFDTVAIDSPGENDVFGNTVCIYGTAWDEFSFSDYVVQYRPSGGGTFLPVDAISPLYTTPVVNDVLATWDTVGVPDGNYTLRVIGSDTAGHSKTDTVNTVVVDNTSPLAVVTSLVSCATRSGPIEIVGSAVDGNLQSWALEYTGGGANGWSTIAAGVSSIVNNSLATWDPTGLPDCAYTLRLVVSDAASLNCNNAIHHRSEYLLSVNLAADATAQDTDGDGMPDVWEDAHLFDPNDPADAAEDADGDHKSNVEEYRAGTDPRDPGSFLEITAVAVEEQDVRVAWTIADSHHYLLQGGAKLRDGMDSNLNALISIPPGSGPVTNGLHVGGALKTNYFYRVRVVH